MYFGMTLPVRTEGFLQSICKTVLLLDLDFSTFAWSGSSSKAIADKGKTSSAMFLANFIMTFDPMLLSYWPESLF